jgi:transposase
MAQEVCVVVGDGDRERLVAIAAVRNHAQKHVQRARIILLSAERLAVAEVARQAGVSRPAVWRWQARYAQAGVDGLLRDKTRPPGRTPVPIETMAQVLALTCSRPPGQATHWTGRAMAKATGISLRSVQRIWDAHRLQPHRLRTFKRSNDPAFAEKVEDIVAVERAVPAGKLIHAIADNYGTHKHPKVRAWLERQPRWTFHFTPTSASWINAVEGFFSALTRRRLRRGIFQSVADLEKAIARYIREHNAASRPFVWTKTADSILAKLSRLPAPSE